MKKYLLLNAILVSFIISSSGFAMKATDKKSRTKVPISDLVNKNNEDLNLLSDSDFATIFKNHNDNSILKISELVNENNEDPNLLSYHDLATIFKNHNDNRISDVSSKNNDVNLKSINSQNRKTKNIKPQHINNTTIKFILPDFQNTKITLNNNGKRIKSFQRHCKECGSVGTFTHTCIKANHRKKCNNCGEIHKKLIYKRCPYNKVNADK